MLAYGDMRELTDEELARAIRLDPSQIAGLAPAWTCCGRCCWSGSGRSWRPTKPSRPSRPPQGVSRFGRVAVRPNRWPTVSSGPWPKNSCASSNGCGTHGRRRRPFAGQLMRLVARLGEKYQVDELAGEICVYGSNADDVSQRIEIKEELETIDRLLKQLEEAAKTAQIGIIDLEELVAIHRSGRVEKLRT